MEQDELDFLRELATDLMALVADYANDPRAAALVEKLDARIADLEAEAE